MKYQLNESSQKRQKAILDALKTGVPLAGLLAVTALSGGGAALNIVTSAARERWRSENNRRAPERSGRFRNRRESKPESLRPNRAAPGSV